MRTPLTPATGVTRRSAIALLAAAAACSTRLSARAGAATPVAATAGPGWSFTDDRGVTLQLDHQPERIVAFSPVAGGLWDLGVRPIGVFGPLTRPDGTTDPQAGSVDPQSVTWLGDWESFDFEALLALEPDLLVGLDLPDVPNTLWYIPEDLYPLVEEKIPTLGLRMQEGQPATALIDRVEELAAALGANLEDPAIAADRAAFESAADAVRAAAGSTGELAVLVIAADTDSVYLANPTWFGDLRLFQDVGVNIVSPPEPDGRWQDVSWEQIGQFPADLYLVDARSGEIPPELASVPTWSALPAVAAGQFAPWQAVYPYSRKAFTPILERLAEAIETTDPGTAN